MWGVVDRSNGSDWSDYELSPAMGRRQELQVYDCGLPSSVYSRCYPVSLTRKASLCSIGTLDSTDHHPSGYYGGGFGLSNNNHFNFEDHHGHGSQWDDSRRPSIKEEDEEEADRGDGYLNHPVASCCYEEECGFGLHDLLTEKLEKQITPLLQSVFAASSSASPSSIVLLGLSSLLSSAVNDILKLAEEEPYGIRGASIILKFRSDAIAKAKGNSSCQDLEKTLGIITMDHATVSTFELTLTLSEERHLGLAFKNWLKSALSGRSAQQAHVISPKYHIAKKKLYR